MHISINLETVIHVFTWEVGVFNRICFAIKTRIYEYFILTAWQHYVEVPEYLLYFICSFESVLNIIQYSLKMTLECKQNRLDYFVKKLSDVYKKYTENDIIGKIEMLVGNLFIRPSVRLSVRPFLHFFSYMLWHIELKFGIWLYFNVLQIKLKCRHFASIFEVVMPLCELKIQVICSFPQFSPTCFDIWNFAYYFFNVLQSKFECRHFASIL